MDIQEKEALIAEIERFKEQALKMHTVQVLADTYERSSLFDYSIDSDGSVIWYKAQARQLWDFWQAKTQAVPEGFVLVPRVITDEWMVAYVDQAVAEYVKDYEDLPFSVKDYELPGIKEGFRLPIRNAHMRLMRVIKAQEQDQ